MNVGLFFRSTTPLALLSFLTSASPCALAVDIQPAIAAYKDAHLTQAKPLFEAAAKDAATKNEALYYLGRIAFDEGDAEKAKDYLDDSVALEPNTSDEYYWLGRAYGELAQQANILKQASYASSVHKYFQLAVAADPKNVAAHRGLFAFYIMAPGFMGGGIDKAEKTLSDIRALSPMDADIKQLDLFSKKEELDKSLAQAKFLVATYPTSAEALFSAGHAFRNQKKLEDAIASFEAASKLTITPQSRMFVESATYLFGETCLWANMRIDDGVVSVEKFLAITAENNKVNKNWPRWTLAKLYRQKDNLEKYQSLRKQLDPAFVKQDKWMREEVEKQDKQDKKS